MNRERSLLLRLEGHPLLELRMLDADFVTADSPLCALILLHDAKPVLPKLGESNGFDITPWTDRVQMIGAEYAGLWTSRYLPRSPLPLPC